MEALVECTSDGSRAQREEVTSEGSDEITKPKRCKKEPASNTIERSLAPELKVERKKSKIQAQKENTSKVNLGSQIKKIRRNYNRTTKFTIYRSTQHKHTHSLYNILQKRGELEKRITRVWPPREQFKNKKCILIDREKHTIKKKIGKDIDSIAEDV